MTNSTALNKICDMLVKKYDKQGQDAANRLREWMVGQVPYTNSDILEEHLEEKHLDLLFDAFWQILPFGTGGRRGRVGYGTNRINYTTIAMTVQGHSNYLRQAFSGQEGLSVVVANDVRVFKDIAGVYNFLGGKHPLVGVSSRSLAKLACEIYTGNGFTAYFAEPANESAVMATPMLSYLINELKAIGGVNLSASHNPPDDNGIKVYDEYGSQPVAPQDQHLIDSMEKATHIKNIPYDEACKRGLIKKVPEELHEKYIKTYVDNYGDIYKPQQDTPHIVYTPLCGCGLTTAAEVLRRLNFNYIIPPKQGPDGTFAVIPLKAPNPEVPQATEPAKEYADANGSGIVLSSDPDADRVGVEIKLADGTWYHFDGNQIATVICYYLMLDPNGPKRKGLVIETLVTTKILGKIAETAGNSWVIDDLLVGIKYIANALKSLKNTGRYGDISCSPQQLVMAAEESHGLFVIPTIWEKDSTPACMYLSTLYQKLYKEGRTLLDYYAGIIEELGNFDNVSRSIMMTGSEGVLRKNRIMASLRKQPFETLGGQKVHRWVDYRDEKRFGKFVSESDKLPRDVLQIFTDTYVVTIRPSGTEPKLKYYCQLLPDGAKPTSKGMELLQEIRSKANAFSLLIYNDILARIEMSLGEAGLLLPDIVDLDCKIDFEQKIAPRLRETLDKGNFANLATLLEWLAKEVSPMTPGADPLPAVKTSIAYLCGQWLEEPGGAHTLLEELRDWAKK